MKCSTGPCIFATPVSPPKKYRPPKKKKRPRPLPKEFPYVKTRLLFLGHDNEDPVAYFPTYRVVALLKATDEVLWDVVHNLSGPMYHYEVLAEINRLPNSRGTQVIHQQVGIGHLGSIGVPGDYAWTLKFDVSDFVRHIAAFQLPYIESLLIEKIAPYYPTPDPWFHGLDNEIATMEAVAFNAMRPQFKTGFSTLNFLLELKDLRDLIPNALRTLRGLKEVVESQLKVMGDLSQKFRRGKLLDANLNTLHQIVDSMAEAKLVKDFGVEPFIGDLDRISKIVCRFEDNFKRFREGADALNLTRHFKAFFEPTTEYRESMTRTVVINLSGFDVTYECKVAYFDSQSNGTPVGHVSYNATLDYTYACKTLMDMDPYVAALYTELGIKPDATIIWNAIPFSFVLDWFFNIQDFLDKYASVELITSEVTIHSWLMGLRARPVWTCTPVGVTWGPRGGVYSLPEITLRGQSYARVLRNPEIEELVTLNSRTPDGLTLNRGVLSACLLKKLVFR